MKTRNSPLCWKKKLIMELLRENPQGMHGLELVAGAHKRLRGSTIYIHLCILEQMGLVAVRREAIPLLPRLPRPIYRLTRRGQRQSLEHPMDCVARQSQTGSRAHAGA